MPSPFETSSNSYNEFVRADRFPENAGKFVQVELTGLFAAHDNDWDMPSLGTGVELLLHIPAAHVRKVQVHTTASGCADSR